MDGLGYRPTKVDSETPRLAFTVILSRSLASQQPNHNGALDYMRAEGYFGSAWGENIAWGGIGSASAVVAGWMSSPGHRANILGPREFSP